MNRAFFLKVFTLIVDSLSWTFLGVCFWKFTSLSSINKLKDKSLPILEHRLIKNESIPQVIRLLRCRNRKKSKSNLTFLTRNIQNCTMTLVKMSKSTNREMGRAWRQEQLFVRVQGCDRECHSLEIWREKRG